MFEIKDVSKKYNGEFALNNITMSINKGLNFIVGPSGSGKTTLLKIMSGLEQDFEGEVTYCDKNIKKLLNKEKAYFYNNIFGFVWQDFNLIENLTVLENILLPTYLKKTQNLSNAKTILKDLGIYDISDEYVKNLSGGQKQRVSIARELVKNPKVIIADEPTSALDEKSSNEVMKILREIATRKTVIIVTHDTSLIRENDYVFELDKGELVSSPKNINTQIDELKIENNNYLSFSNAILLVKTNIKRSITKNLIAIFSVMVAMVLLLTTFSGAINNSSTSDFKKLIETYGEGVLDIVVCGEFTSAAGSGNNKKDEPSADVSQDISGLYDVYLKDDRVSFTTYLQAFTNIQINLEGKNYKIKNSGNSPSIEKIIAGRLPNGLENEVVVPESFVKKLGIKSEDAIGKKINFTGEVYKWINKEPIPEKTSIEANITGVINSTVKYDTQEGKVAEYVVDDAFLFSKNALDTMLKKVGKSIEKLNFSIRAKSPQDMISIKDELNKKGIVPIGRFEIIEDIVRLQKQTSEQSDYANIIIEILAIFMIIAIFIVTGFMRKKEYAIYKVSGFNNGNLSFMNFVENLIHVILTSILFVIMSPIINSITEKVFSANILNLKMLLIGIGLAIGINIITYIINELISIKTDITKTLKTGDR